MESTYTDKQLLDRVRDLPSFAPHRFRILPKYLLIGVRSKDDVPDAFDDKAYLYVNGVFVLVTSCTTNPGVSVLKKGWFNFSKLGAAVLKSDEFYFEAYQKSDGKSVPHHHFRMQCLRQMEEMLYYRDNNNNDKSEELGEIYKGNFSTNVHGANYNLLSKVKTVVVGNWSAGCQVVNDIPKYASLLNYIPLGVRVSYALLKEF